MHIDQPLAALETGTSDAEQCQALHQLYPTVGRKPGRVGRLHLHHVCGLVAGVLYSGESFAAHFVPRASRVENIRQDDIRWTSASSKKISRSRVLLSFSPSWEHLYGVYKYDFGGSFDSGFYCE